MSKKSPDKKPYYLKYGEPTWYTELPNFPEGRDPYTDLFTEDAIIGIVTTVRTNLLPNTSELQRDLRDLSFCFMSVALTTPIGLSEGPSNIKRNQRVRTLNAHVVNPARKLLNSLGTDSAHLLSDWPDQSNSPTPDKAILVEQLERLVRNVEDTVQALEDRKNDKSTSLTEFQTDLANALTLVFEEHFPHLPRILDSYDRATDMNSAYASFVEMCAEEIFPYDKAISNEIVDSLVHPIARKSRAKSARVVKRN